MPSEALGSDAANQLLAEARAVRARAHAPFSQFPVGAALRDSDGRIFVGCNVESSSYGLSICAERSALARAVADGASRIVAVAVIADTPIPCSPCGACRQLLMDLAPDCQVIMSNLHGAVTQQTIRELLPAAFSAQHLPPKPG